MRAGYQNSLAGVWQPGGSKQSNNFWHTVHWSCFIGDKSFVSEHDGACGHAVPMTSLQTQHQNVNRFFERITTRFVGKEYLDPPNRMWFSVSNSWRTNTESFCNWIYPFGMELDCTNREQDKRTQNLIQLLQEKLGFMWTVCQYLSENLIFPDRQFRNSTLNFSLQIFHSNSH